MASLPLAQGNGRLPVLQRRQQLRRMLAGVPSIQGFQKLGWLSAGRFAGDEPQCHVALKMAGTVVSNQVRLGMAECETLAQQSSHSWYPSGRCNL
jgi:hypothetical protein